MKFFLSPMEISKEAVRVGTLALIRAVVSADGEHSRRRKTGRELGWQVSLISGLFFFFLKLLAAPCGGMWDLSALPGDRTRTPCVGSTES